MYSAAACTCVGTPLQNVAEESWYKHLQRNRSVVVSVFQGQLKTTLDCSKCKQVGSTSVHRISLGIIGSSKKIYYAGITGQMHKSRDAPHSIVLMCDTVCLSASNTNKSEPPFLLAHIIL